MSVTEFKRPEKPQLHSCGDAICANCRHEWQAVVPAGATGFECPECGTHRGAFMHPFGPADDEESYECNCGSVDFFISRKPGQASGAVHCCGCGLVATGWFE